MPVPQSRFVTITDYRVDLQESGYLVLPARTSYVAWGHEVCPSTQRCHLQVWAYGEKRSAVAWAKDFGNSHVELMRGSIHQNDAYCSKVSELKELGVKPMESGQKRTLHELTDRILETGTAPVQLALQQPLFAPAYVQYHRGLERLANAKRMASIKADRTAPEVIWIHGEPGSGKSKYVYDREPDIFDVPPDDGYKWKDGYAGELAVLYDNLSASGLRDKGRLLKEWDRYPIQCACKGGFVPWKPSRIYVTSIQKPEDVAVLFDDSRELLRRITSVIAL